MPEIKKVTPFDLEPQLKQLRRRMMQAMRERGYDVNSLAAACDLSRCSISFYLGGQRLPQPVSLVRITRVLKVSADWLLGYDCLPSGRRKKVDDGTYVESEGEDAPDWLWEAFPNEEKPVRDGHDEAEPAKDAPVGPGDGPSRDDEGPDGGSYDKGEPDSPVNPE